MIDLYKDSNKICQTIILSVVDKPKEIICLVVQSIILTKHASKKQSDSLNIPKIVKHNHQIMDQLKCEHFLDYTFTSGILMDVADGTTNINYDSGET